MNFRSRLTYANVVATLALFLAVAGGTVYAAVEIGKNDVKSKNIAKGAVKTSDLHTDAVIGAKVKDATITGADLEDGTITAGEIANGSITAEDIVAGVIPQIDADVVGSSTHGPQGGVNTATSSPLPLSGTTSVTPDDGDVVAVVGEAEFTSATTNGANFCSPAVRVLVNGEETRVDLSPIGDSNNTTLATFTGYDADGPFGLLHPGQPIDITAALDGDADCTANSQLDQVKVTILRIR